MDDIMSRNFQVMTALENVGKWLGISLLLKGRNPRSSNFPVLHVLPCVWGIMYM